MVSLETSAGLTIVFDPYGLHLKAYGDPQVSGDLVLTSHNNSDHSNVDLVKGDPIVLRGVHDGKVEPVNIIVEPAVGGGKPSMLEANHYDEPLPENAVMIQTIASYHDKQQGQRKGNNAMFLVEASGLRILHAGDIGQSELSKSQIEQAYGIDVLIIPVGGKNTVNAEEALTMIHQLHPKYVMPIHFGVAGLVLTLDPLDDFLQKLPGDFEQVHINGNSLTISQKANSSAYHTKVVIMESLPAR